MSNLFDEITEIFRETIGEDEIEISPEMTFEELDIDSLDLLEVVTTIEMKYAIEIPDEKLKTVKTVGEAIDMVNELI